MADSYKVFDKSPIVDDAVSVHGYSFRKREIALAGVALVALIVCIILAALLASANSGGKGGGGGGLLISAQTGGKNGSVEKPCKKTTCGTVAKPCEDLCLTSMCMQSAAYVIDSKNSTIQPCNNFFQYACGTWALNNPLKPDVAQLTPPLNIFHDNELRLREILESSSSKNTEHSAERKLKHMFSSCTDAYEKMKRRGRPFLDQIVSKIGGWYGINTFNETTFDFEDALRKTHVDFWTDAFFTFSVKTDLKDWTKQVIQIDLSGTSLHWSYYMEGHFPKVIADYKKFMKKVGALLIRDSGVKYSDDERAKRIDTFVDDAFSIEQELASVTDKSKLTENPHELINRKSLSQLNNYTSDEIDWVAFFTYMFKDAGVTADTKVVVLEAEYIKDMTNYIKDMGANKARKLNNYLVSRLAYRYVQDLSWDYIHANRELYVDVTGVAEFLGAYRYCFRMVHNDMGDALSSLFVRDHFSTANKQKAEEIVKYLRDALLDSMTTNSWMDSDTRSLARDKLLQSVDKLGYPDFMIDEDKLDNMYSMLTVTEHDQFANRMNMNKFYKFQWNQRLKHGTDKTHWGHRVYDVVATFFNPWNEMIVPAGVLQWPLYDHKLPHFMNFGSLGTILGHTFVHAIDENGRDFDTSAKQMHTWWTNATIEAYEAVKKCVIDAYSNKTMGPFRNLAREVFHIPVHAEYYSPEALAETSGVRFAFKAFKQWEKKHSVERRAPGLSNSNDQMFFLAYAQTRCYNRTPQKAYALASQRHVQEDIMVNMALSQVPEFKKAFNCPDNSKMVAKKICTMYN